MRRLAWSVVATVLAAGCLVGTPEPSAAQDRPDLQLCTPQRVPSGVIYCFSVYPDLSEMSPGECGEGARRDELRPGQRLTVLGRGEARDGERTCLLVRDEKDEKWWLPLAVDDIPPRAWKELISKVPEQPVAAAPGRPPSEAVPSPSGSSTGGHRASTSMTCVSPGDIAKAPDKVSYVAYIGEKGGREARLPMFSEIAGDYVEAEPAKINNPWLRSAVRFTPARSLKFVPPQSPGEKPQHFVEVTLPPGATLETTPPKVPFTLRVISSRRGLYRLDLKGLAEAYRAAPYAMKLRIIWDEIVPGGALKSAVAFDDIGKFANDVPVSTDPVDLSENEAVNLFKEIEKRLIGGSSEGAFDRVLLITGNWSYPYQVIPSVEAIHIAGMRRQTGKWLQVLAERTAAAGNAYLQAALDRTGVGTLTEDRDKAKDEPLVEHEQLLRDVDGESRSKAIREGRPVATTRREVVTESNAAQLRVGHIMKAEGLSALLDALRQLEAALGGSSDAADAGASAHQFLAKRVPGFSLPRTARLTVHHPIAALSDPDRRGLQEIAASAAKAITMEAVAKGMTIGPSARGTPVERTPRAAAPSRCPYVFVPDRLLALEAIP